MHVKLEIVSRLLVFTLIVLLPIGCIDQQLKDESASSPIEKILSEIDSTKSICKIKNTDKDIEINGKVKTIKEYKFEANKKFGEFVQNEEWESSNHYCYNEEGKLIEKRSYSRFGASPVKHIYKYDDKNYNRAIIEYYYNDTPSEIEIISYNKDGSISERNTYNSDGEIRVVEKLKYDNSSNKIEDSTYDANGDLYSQVKLKYDNKGNVIESQLWGIINNDTNDSYTIHKYIKYDNYDNKVEEKGSFIYTYPSLSKAYFRDLFDIHGNKTVHYFNVNKEERPYETLLEYDKNNNLIKEIDNEIRTLNYTYDNLNNWIKIEDKTAKNHKEIDKLENPYYSEMKIKLREIEYYE